MYYVSKNVDSTKVDYEVNLVLHNTSKVKKGHQVKAPYKWFVCHYYTSTDCTNSHNDSDLYYNDAGRTDERTDGGELRQQEMPNGNAAPSCHIRGDSTEAFSGKKDAQNVDGTGTYLSR